MVCVVSMGDWSSGVCSSDLKQRRMVTARSTASARPLLLLGAERSVSVAGKAFFLGMARCETRFFECPVWLEIPCRANRLTRSGKGILLNRILFCQIEQ